MYLYYVKRQNRNHLLDTEEKLREIEREREREREEDDNDADDDDVWCFRPHFHTITAEPYQLTIY